MSGVVAGVRRAEEVMGMPVTVNVADPGVPAAVLDEVFDDFAMLDRIFSPFREDSAVSRVNAGKPVDGEAAAQEHIKEKDRIAPGPTTGRGWTGASPTSCSPGPRPAIRGCAFRGRST